jgi:hypothetical protein
MGFRQSDMAVSSAGRPCDSSFDKNIECVSVCQCVFV